MIRITSNYKFVLLCSGCLIGQHLFSVHHYLFTLKKIFNSNQDLIQKYKQVHCETYSAIPFSDHGFPDSGPGLLGRLLKYEDWSTLNWKKLVMDDSTQNLTVMLPLLLVSGAIMARISAAIGIIYFIGTELKRLRSIGGDNELYQKMAPIGEQLIRWAIISLAIMGIVIPSCRMIGAAAAETKTYRKLRWLLTKKY